MLTKVHLVKTVVFPAAMYIYESYFGHLMQRTDLLEKTLLLLGRKVMANLDSILKSRDFTLPTNVCVVKAMVFLVVMYRCESWIIKKAEH